MIVEKANDLRRVLAKLRRDLTACQTCEVGSDCVRWQQFQMTVNRAILEVNQEWTP
jgi:hypothetical protein